VAAAVPAPSASYRLSNGETKQQRGELFRL